MNSIIISHNIWHIVLVITFSLQLCCPLTCLALQGCHPVLNKAQQLWTFSSYSQPFFHPVFQVTGRSSISPELGCHPILPEFFCSIVNESLAEYQCSLSSTLWHQPFCQSLSPFVHLHCYQPDSFNPGVQSLYSRWWVVFITLAWSAQYPNYRAGTPCAWGWTRVTKRHPILLWGIYSEIPSSVPGSLSTPPPGLQWINSISSHFFRPENQQKPASLGGMSQVVHGNESHPPLAEELCYLLNGLRKKARLTVLAYPGILVFKKNHQHYILSPSVHNEQQGRRRDYRRGRRVQLLKSRRMLWAEELGAIHLPPPQASWNSYYWPRGLWSVPSCLLGPLCQNWWILWWQHCLWKSLRVALT